MAMPIAIPPAEKNGFIPTLNRQGYMLSFLDVYTQAFVEFAGSCSKPVADIGAAYGVATLPALKVGAEVIAVDIDDRHLQLLRSQAPQGTMLTTVCAAFPEAMDFAPSSIGAFLVARVVHFFTPARLEQAAKKLCEWLAPEGKVFLTAETPYLKNWEAFIPVYEARREAKELWPGFVEDVMRYTPDRGKNLPSTMLLLDPDVLRRVFQAAGFLVEKADFLARPEFPDDMRRDGRESVGIICRK
jgi:SAM-dependent methyltransferase